jgi:hypothetical protein
MVEVHAELMRVLTQNLIDSDSKELPPGIQQVLHDRFSNGTNEASDFGKYQSQHAPKQLW